MGKIRVTTIGDESAEKEQKETLKKRKEARLDSAERARRFEKTEQKDAVKAASDAVIARSEATKQPHKKTEEQATSSPEEEKLSEAKSADGGKKKKEKFLKKKASPHSSKYNAVVSLIDKNKVYSLKEALAILPKLKTAKFDETVELHINTTETGVSGSIVLPHGTGKKMRATIVDATKDPKGIDELIKNIEAGKIDFDILIATPDSMSRLAKVARYLGPKGLMPNPKSGTVTTKPEEVAKKYEGGQVNFKTEAKFPILHMIVGKMSYGDAKLSDNIKTALKAVRAEKMKSVTLKSTMSPGIKIDFSII